MFIANGPVLFCRRHIRLSEFSDRSVCLCRMFFDWKMILMLLLGILYFGTVIRHPRYRPHPPFCAAPRCWSRDDSGAHAAYFKTACDSIRHSCGVSITIRAVLLCRRHTRLSEHSDRSVCLCLMFFDWKMILMLLLGILYFGTVIRHPRYRPHPPFCAAPRFWSRNMSRAHTRYSDITYDRIRYSCGVSITIRAILLCPLSAPY